ncbi:L-histidine N(alpha)-methyltransferase [Mariniflexile litorale]|uniref:L-histidine N(Alpha)-methyltransferase n=1 Tax=Mariniflexile litorale TaxID=3045158 RepID=A0AAU7ECE0_9FLAO|nr:L-histidine N(alpha)-methyltransferase [Mariniflexile sp. KMM 9835]MDQ8212958.1 L-histidine N(alpha)-methyltransferase [Mariniflexile sp. KMM 9835]
MINNIETSVKKTINSESKTFNSLFKMDVLKGLSSHPKFLSSKYFYDKKGDALFVKIMNMPEYYLTNSEYDIFKNKTEALVHGLDINKNTDFDLIELGAGDGMKTKELLKYLDRENYQFTFIPVDISQNALNNLETSLNEELPHLSIETKQGDYFHVLEDIKTLPKPKVILFLGSNIGNLNDDQARKFMLKLSNTLHKNDKIVLGIDLIKSEDIVLPAYNDEQGITKQFNLNILARMNRELDADFDLNAFTHSPKYNEEEGIAESFLVSKIDQTVRIKVLDMTFNFYKNETIHTEISRKYNDSILEHILEHTDLNVKDKLTDSKNYFADYILNKSNH